MTRWIGAGADMRGLRVLITGGAGFIGSELVRQAAGSGAEVTVLDNLVNGRVENLEDVLGDNVRLVTGDIRDESLAVELMDGTDIVYHLACLGVRHSIHSPGENHSVNATGTLNLLAAARVLDVRRFVYVSTSEVYGTASQVPMSEAHPTLPHTVYGAGKLAGECYARAYFLTYGLPTVVVRPFNTYGPRCHHEGDSGEVIPKFMLNSLAGRPLVVFGDGRQTRDFTYVSDTARAIRHAGLSDAAVGRTINVGSGREIEMRELARLVCTVVGHAAPVRHDAPRPGDVLRLCADATTARALLGFEPQVTFSAGLAMLRDWYLSHGRAPHDLLQEEVVHNWHASDPVRSLAQVDV